MRNGSGLRFHSSRWGRATVPVVLAAGLAAASAQAADGPPPAAKTAAPATAKPATAAPPAAKAPPAKKIEKTRPAAIEHAKAGRFREAGEAFEGAYETTSDPDNLFDAGVAFQKAGEAARATAALKRYLTADPKGKNAARARELIDAMKADVAKLAGIGTLVLTTSVPGAIAKIDGRDMGTTPISAELAAGDHSVQVEKEGYLLYSAPVTVVPGELTSVAVRLERDPGYAPASGPALLPAAGAGASPAAASGALAPDAPRTPVTKRKWFWPAVGGAAGLAVLLTLVAVIRPVERVPEGSLGRQEFRR